MREWRVYLIDPRPGAPDFKRDITALYDAPASAPPQTIGGQIGQGRILLRDIDDMPDLAPDDLLELWEGWVDPATDEFDATLEHAGYYIHGHTNKFTAAQHVMESETADYNILLDTSPIITWPTDLVMSEAAAGYPAGYNVRQWLVGDVGLGDPYNGVISFHFPHGNIDIGGIDPVFEDIILDEYHWPTMPNVDQPDEFGMVGFTGLREWLDEIMRMARLAARDQLSLDIAPAYGFRTIVNPADPTELMPQFVCTDLSNAQATGTVVARYSIDPDPDAGIYPFEKPLLHERDPKSVRTEVVVMGDGDRGAGFFWSVRDKPEGKDRHPARYHRRLAWGGPPVLNPNIINQDVSDAYAQNIVDVMWGARGRLSFYVRTPRNLKPGDFIELHCPPEGQDHHVLPILSVVPERREGSVRWRVTVGEREIQISDILVPRAAAPLILPGTGGGMNRGGTAAGEWAGGAGRPAPRQRAIVNVAMQPLQNVVQGVNNTVPTLDLRQNPKTVSVPGDTPTTVPASDISRLGSTWNSDALAWVKRVWVDRYGTPHQQKLSTFFLSDTTNYLNVDERMTIRRARKSNDPAQSGVTFSLAVNHIGTITDPVATVNGAGVLSGAFEVLPGDEIIITASGVSGHATLTLVSGDPL